MVASLKVEGFKELDALLQSIPRHLNGTSSGVNAGMRKALKPVADAARAYAPGGLDDSIKVAMSIKSSQLRDSLVKPGKGKRVMWVGSTAPHAHLVEFGTGPRFHKSGRYVGFMSPDPFMRAAWDTNKQEVLARLSDSIRDEIARAIGKRVKKASFIGPQMPKGKRNG